MLARSYTKLHQARSAISQSTLEAAQALARDSEDMMDKVMDNNNFAAVIMAGGSGQRFWPLSTADYPKQFLDLERQGRTLIQATFDRLLPVAQQPERIFVVTGERYAALVREQLPLLPAENVIVEPTGRDTAPAVALAALTLKARLGNPVMGLFASDHRVGKPEAFQALLGRAIALAQETLGIVTLGIKPSFAATGYGYIERGKALHLPEFHDAYRVARFVEKPNLAKAEEYLATGHYDWNAGIFLWHVETILGELAQYSPALLQLLRQAMQAGTVADVFPTLQKISIDYAVMEKTSKAYVLQADVDWDDIGDWVALERLLEADQSINTVVGKHIGLETSNNIIYTTDENDTVVTLGVHDLVVVKRGNTVFLVAKDRVQDIKKLLGDDRLSTLM